MYAFGEKADIGWTFLDVRFWHKADIPLCSADVCFRGKRKSRGCNEDGLGAFSFVGHARRAAASIISKSRTPKARRPLCRPRRRRKLGAASQSAVRRG